MAIKRLQIYCQRYALGSMDKHEFNIHRRQVIGSFASFKPGTRIEQEMLNHESFKPAYEAVQAFLEAAEQFEDGRMTLGRVFDIRRGVGSVGPVGRRGSLASSTAMGWKGRSSTSVRSRCAHSCHRDSFDALRLAIAFVGYAARRAWLAERRRSIASSSSWPPSATTFEVLCRRS